MDGPSHKRALSTDIAEQHRDVLDRETQALLAWANTFLKQRSLETGALSDFHDGVLLINLLEVSFGVRISGYNRQPKTPFHKLANLSLAFDFMRSKGVLLLSLDTNDILKKREKQTLTVLWNTLRCLTLRGLRGLTGKDVDDDSGSSGGSDTSVRETLLTWANDTFQGVTDTQVSDFWESFRDGVAFCAIVDQLSPGSIDVASLSKDNAQENLALAFRVAEETLGIPSLLKPEAFAADGKGDEKSVENYVCMLVSAAQGKAKKDREVNEIKKQLQSEKQKKAQEVEELKTKMDEEKKQFEELQRDVEAMRKQALESETALKEKLAAADSEKSSFVQQFDVLNTELQKAREALMQARVREEEMLTKQSTLEQELDSAKEDANRNAAEANQLSSELYALHREHENVVENFRSDMKQEAMLLRSSSSQKLNTEESLNELLGASIRESKGYADFLNAMPVKRGWLRKRRPGKGGKKWIGGTAWKKRYFELRGDTLYYYVNKGDAKPKGSDNISFFKKVPFTQPVTFDPDDFYTSTRASLTTPDSSEEFVIHLEPKETSEAKSGGAKVMELVNVASVLPEFQEDVFEWVESINTRISLIEYLHEMFEKGQKAKGCRELVEFITDLSLTELRIENRMTDIHTALVHFKDSLILRRGLHIVFSHVALTDPSVEVLAEILSRNHTIESLELPYNLISAEGAKMLAEGIKTNKYLKTLRLDHNQIGDEGVRYLAEALPDHRTLSTLTLSGNGLTDTAVQHIVQGLRESHVKNGKMHNFVSFSLSANLIGDEGCRLIHDLLVENSTLVEIHLSNNLVTDTGVKHIARALELPETKVTSIHLAGNQISSKGVAVLASALKSKQSTSITVDLSRNKLLGVQGLRSLLNTNLSLSFADLVITTTPASEDTADAAATEDEKKQE